ncbi:uncharacterized protein V6R79_015291 [Siganus canaliculatus]
MIIITVQPEVFECGHSQGVYEPDAAAAAAAQLQSGSILKDDPEIYKPLDFRSDTMSYADEVGSFPSAARHRARVDLFPPVCEDGDGPSLKPTHSRLQREAGWHFGIHHDVQSPSGSNIRVCFVQTLKLWSKAQTLHVCGASCCVAVPVSCTVRPASVRQ